MAASIDYPLFPIFAFFGFILPLIPLSWHLKAGNSGTCFYIFWASASCLNQFVNSIVWKGNVINWAPVWCDISIRITMAATVGLPASSFCIMKRLYGIAAIRTVSLTRAEKRRAVIFDCLICGLWPMVYLALQYIVQGHRFNLYEDFGCMPAIFNTIPAYFIAYLCPLLFGVVSAVYCTLALRAFAHRRLEFARFMSHSKGLSVGQYFRLMALAMTEMLCSVPLTIFMIWLSATQSPVSPWISLANTHFDYSRVEQFPSVIYNLNPVSVMGIFFTRWASVACALLFFVFFGFAEEARRNYGLWYSAVLRGLRLRSPSLDASSPKGAKSAGLPTYQNGALSGFNELKLAGDGNAQRATPLSRHDICKSILGVDSRSTICFPDDDVELSPFKSISRPDSLSSPSSPSSSSCTYSPRTPVTPSVPPHYIDSAYLDAAAVALSKKVTSNTSHSESRTPSPEIDSREEAISITDAYFDSRPMPTHPAPVEVPLPPAAMASHRPPHLYPVTRLHTVGTQNPSGGMEIMIHTKSSRETL